MLDKTVELTVSNIQQLDNKIQNTWDGIKKSIKYRKF